MKTYSQIRAEIAKLEERAEAARKAEVAGVVGRIKQAIAFYGLSASDLGFVNGKIPNETGRSRAKDRPAVGAPKYRDPKTGKTWTGHGRSPAWIAGVKDRDAFLIDGPQPAGKQRARKAAKSAKAMRQPGRKSRTADAAAAPAALAIEATPPAQ
jgi:DNA-binding protein H-NS